MLLTSARARAEKPFIPVYLDSLRVDTVLGFDLYLKVEHHMVLYRSADLPFTDRTRQKLMDNKVERLYVSSHSRDAYQHYLEKNLAVVLKDPEVPDEKKAGILYETSTNLVKDVLANPTYGENVRRTQDLISNTVDYILKGRDAFHNLLKITSFDYYTYTHSVNVCTFSVALARQAGFVDEQSLNELGVGALLHDVGKSRVSDRILNKHSGLNPTEFEIMKKHPKLGVDMLRETDRLAARSYYPVLQHHERGDGQGYPNGLTLEEMHIFSRIVAIADTFDAMTTKRVYQKAVESFPALKIMFSLRGAFDEALLQAFVELMGPTGLADI